MTRKHFITLAESMARIKPPDDRKHILLMWEQAVVSIADACREHNSNFQRQRFYDACNFTK